MRGKDLRQDRGGMGPSSERRGEGKGWTIGLVVVIALGDEQIRALQTFACISVYVVGCKLFS